MQYSSHRQHHGPTTLRSTTRPHSWASMQSVEEDEVLLPEHLYFPIAHNEKVVASEPSMYVMTCVDKFWTIVPMVLPLWISVLAFWLNQQGSFGLGLNDSQDDDETAARRSLSVKRVATVFGHLRESEIARDRDTLLAVGISALVLLLFFKSVTYYLYVLRPRRMLRPGFVITTSRFVEISVMRRLGVNCCSSGPCSICNGCCDCCVVCGGCGCCPMIKGYKVRSLFPHEVTSARLSRNSRFGPLSLTGEKSLELAVGCGGAGAFNIEFDLKNNTKEKIEKRIAFCQALMCTTSRQVISGVRELTEEPDLNEFESTMYPLLPNEKVVARYPAKVFDDWWVGVQNIHPPTL